jgi:hypothetical protein
MFKRIAGIALVGVTIFCILPAQASPIGFYIKPSGMKYWGDGISKKENMAGALAFAYQFNRSRLLEFTYTLPWTSIKTSSFGDDHVKHAFTFINKDLIPLKYYLNLYTQWGASWKSNFGIHAPFGGVGIAYYHTRWMHIDLSWRHYGLFSNLSSKSLLQRDASPKSRQNSIVLGFGYYIRR